MLLPLRSNQLLLGLAVATVRDESLEYTLFVQVKRLQGCRLLRVLEQTADFVEAVQVVPLAEEPPQLEAIVQILGQLT